MALTEVGLLSASVSVCWTYDQSRNVALLYRTSLHLVVWTCWRAGDRDVHGNDGIKPVTSFYWSPVRGAPPGYSIVDAALPWQLRRSCDAAASRSFTVTGSLLDDSSSTWNHRRLRYSAVLFGRLDVRPIYVVIYRPGSEAVSELFFNEPRSITAIHYLYLFDRALGVFYNVDAL